VQSSTKAYEVFSYIVSGYFVSLSTPYRYEGLVGGGGYSHLTNVSTGSRSDLKEYSGEEVSG